MRGRPADLQSHNSRGDCCRYARAGYSCPDCPDLNCSCDLDPFQSRDIGWEALLQLRARFINDRTIIRLSKMSDRHCPVMMKTEIIFTADSSIKTIICSVSDALRAISRSAER